MKKISLMIQKNTLIFLFTFLFIITQAQSQNTNTKTIDSLKLELKKTNSISKKTDLLLSISSYPDYIDTDESLNYAKDALIYAKKENNLLKMGDAYGKMGITYEIKSDFVSALKNFYKAQVIFEKLNDTKRLVGLYNNIGLIYVDLKNYNQGLYFYDKALQLSYKSKVHRNISLLLNNIGDVNLQKKQYNKALNYFYKALIMNKKLNDIEGISLNLTNIGICYVNLKKYDKGLEMINQSVLTYTDKNNFYTTYNTYELGRVYYFKSLEEQNKVDKKKYIEKSIGYFNQTLVNFKKYKSLKDIQDTYFYLAKVNKEYGNPVIALDYYEKYFAIKDSLFSKESEKRLANLEFQREIDLRDNQIEIQKLKINRNSRQVYFLITITISVLLLLILLLWLYLSKRKANKIISNINTQKDRFFSIIAHDLRGPFNGFLGLTELMAEEIENMSSEEIKFAAINMRSSAKNLFNLLENLLEWSRMEQNLIPFDPKNLELIPLLSESILTMYDNAFKKEITINTDIETVKTIHADKNMFQALIRNIVMNAIKFTPKKGRIDICTKENLTDTIICIKDSGIGMNPKILHNLFKLGIQNNRIGTEEEPSTGLGLILCKEYIEKHKGKIWAESIEGKGSTFYISFPKK